MLSGKWYRDFAGTISIFGVEMEIEAADYKTSWYRLLKKKKNTSHHRKP
jgi:hypothetical protein